MLLVENNKSRRIVEIISVIALIAVSLLILNKIETAPQKISNISGLSEFKVPEENKLPDTLEAGITQIYPEVEYPKQVIIGLKSWSDVESAKNIITANGGQILNTLKWPTKNVIIALLPNRESEAGILKNSFWGKLIGGIGLTSFGNNLSGGVDYVESDAKVYAQATNPIDWGVKKMGVNKVWAITTGVGVKVAAIDSGAERNHPDLVGNLKGGVNFVSGSSDQWDDGNGHGTEVLGLMGAKNNDIGYVGVAPDADLYAVRVLENDGSGPISAMISGIYWAADNGMDVVNISLGWHLDPSSQANIIAEERQALSYGYGKGVVFVASSGNSGSAPDCNKVMYPAAISEYVVAVGATMPDNSIAPFSCHGPEVEFVAPGLGNWAPGLNGTYGQHTGTSVSSPFVAGVVALLISENPEFAPEQIREKIRASAIDLGIPGRDEYSGYGIVNAYNLLVPKELPATINLITPKTSDNWLEGSKREVRWTMSNVSESDPVEKVDIKLIHKQGDVSTVIPVLTDEENDGFVSVNVPTSLPPTSATDSYFLQVSCGTGFLGSCQLANSGPLNLTVSPPQVLTVISPDGGERWGRGTTHEILWKANYFNEINLNVILFGKKQIPTYSFIPGTETHVCYNASGYCLGSGELERNLVNYTYTAANGVPQISYGPVPDDTCDGNKAVYPSGLFHCPATNSGSTFKCRDIYISSNNVWHWEALVSCSYKSGPPYIDSVEKIGLVAENIPNIGSAEIDFSNDLVGENYYLGLECVNFGGECMSDRSDNPFSLVDFADPVTLSIKKIGTGTVTDGNIICGNNNDSCFENIEKGSIISLTAKAPDTTTIFTGWEGACTGLGVCQIGMTEDREVTAVFAVRSVTLTAIAEPGSIFTGWSGDCLTSNQCFVSWSNACATDVPCNITLGKDESVKANFIKNTLLTVNVSGTGTGTVTGNNKNIRCTGGTCLQKYSSAGEFETLRATANPGSTFAGWFGGTCSGSTSQCFFQMNQSRTVTAVFNLPCTADTWICQDWSACASGNQTRTCELVNCPAGADVPSPPTTQACGPGFEPGEIKEVKPN